MPSIRLNRAIATLILALPLAAGAQQFEIVADRSLETDHSLLKIQPGTYKVLPDYLRERKILARPSGGRIGHVRISGHAAPLTARLRIYSVKESDLLPLKNPPLDHWFQPSALLKQQAPQRRWLYEQIQAVAPGETEVPIVLPQTLGSDLARCTFELLDPAGNILFQCVPAEVFMEPGNNFNSSKYDVWLAADDNTAASRINAQTEMAQEESITNLPADWQRYSDIQAVWVDSETKLPVDTLRRFILTGGWILGRPESMPQVADKLGIPTDSFILGGGLHGLEGTAGDGQLTAPKRLSSRQHVTVKYDLPTNVLPLENNSSLFSAIKGRMLIFTIGLTGCYMLGACILLPLLYTRTKPAERTALWWKLPAGALVCTLSIAGIGWGIVIPKHPVSDVTEYRFGYADWPEVFCHTDAQQLKYGLKPLGWKLPSDTAELHFDSESTKRVRNDSTLIFNDGAMGNKTAGSFAHFANTNQPFRAVLKSGHIEITTDRDVRNVCVGHRIYHDKLLATSIGTLRAGETAKVFQSDKQVLVDGLPDYLKTHMEYLPEVDFPAPGNYLLIVALDAHDRPAVTPLNNDKNAPGRVAWICQVPVEGAVQ